MNRIFEKRLALPCSARAAFEWHERPDALEKLIPPGDPVRVVEHRPGLQGPIGDGARVVLAIGPAPFQMRWVAVHEGYEGGRRFVDVQVRGPFAFWRHTHLFDDTGAGHCAMTDHVEYCLPFGLAGDWAGGWLVRRKLEKMFAWRHAVTARALAG